MGLPYISVACGCTDLRRVKLLPPDRGPHLFYLAPFEYMSLTVSIKLINGKIWVFNPL